MEMIASAVEQLELRKVGDHHELDVRIVPYGVTTYRVKKPERMIAGAFAGATVYGPGKIRLIDHNHDEERRPAAVAQHFDDRADAFYGTFRFYDTPTGREALEEVREGTYGGVSVGFVALEERMAGGIREITKAKLAHVSLVDEPAYADAEILAVRSAERFEHLRRAPEPVDIVEIPMLTPLITGRRRASQ